MSATDEDGHAAAVPAVLVPRRDPQPRGARRRPGSIHEGGELGYVLSHAYGAAMDNPDLLVAAVVGDGEFETGPLAASWHANKFVDPVHDGAVLPILHLNGYKIANPTVPARIPRDELEQPAARLRPRGADRRGRRPGGRAPADGRGLDEAHDRIREIQRAAREDGDLERRPWPMILLVTPKGWTGPDCVDGVQVEGTWRAHQVPLAATRENDDHRRQLEEWLRSYRPEELFDDDGRLVARAAGARAAGPPADERQPARERRAAAPAPRAAGLPRPRGRRTAPGGSVARAHPGARAVAASTSCATTRDNFRIFGPDETASNRLDAVYEVTDKVSRAGSWTSTSTWPAAGGWWRCSRSTPARAGSRATC